MSEITSPPDPAANPDLLGHESCDRHPGAGTALPAVCIMVG